MFRAALKSINANRLRFTLTALSVTLGVAFVAGSFVFTDTINARFEKLFTDIYAGVDATVRPAVGTAALDESLLDEIQNADGVARAQGSVSGVAQLIATDGEPIGGNGPPTLGFSWVDDPALNALRIDPVNGRAPANPGEIAIDVTTAVTHGFTLGDEVRAQTRTGTENFTLVGLASFGTEDNLAGATLAAFELSEAQRLFDLAGRLSTIDAVAEPGVTQDALVSSLASILPDTIEVITGAEGTGEALEAVTEGLGFLSTALLAFAGVAVFVGAFVIQNTFRITIAQRVRELALLRAVGATSGQVTRLVLIEALILGLVASVLGVVLGVGLAELIKAAMTGAGIGIPDGPLTVEPRTIVVALLVGVIVTICSSVLPARRAASIPPVAAMGEPDHRPAVRSLRNRAWVGGALTVGGLGLMASGLVSGNGSALAQVSGGAVSAFLGASTLAPLLAAPIARMLSLPIRGITGTLARENTIRQPRRTASTASALMIGVALVAFGSIFAASIKASASDTLDQAFPADLAFASSNITAGLSPVAIDTLADVDELSVVSAVRTGSFEIDGVELNLIGVEPTTIGLVYDPGTSIAFVDIGDGMLVQEGVLAAHNWTVGDVVTVNFPAAQDTSIEVVGTFETQQFGNFIVSNEVFTAYAPSVEIGMAFARIADDVSVEDAKAAAAQALAEFPAIDVTTRSDQLAEAETQIDQLVAMFSGLLGLAVVIALLGITNTLALSIVERVREIGLLRAIGMSRRQVRSMIRWEAVFTAVFGTVLGIAMGSVLGTGVVWSLADEGLSTVAFPTGQLIVWFILAGLAGVLAAVGPARRAARLDVLAAISSE